LTTIQTTMATAVDLQNKHDAAMQSLSNLSTQVGTPAQATALATAETNLTNLQRALSTQVGTPAQAAALITAQNAIDQALLDIADIRANMPTGASDLSQINAKLDTLQTTLETVPTGNVDLTEITTQLTSVENTIKALQSEQPETGSLMAKLGEIEKSVESSQGSAAAVGFSQSAYSAAGEAVKILQQLQTEIKTNTIQSPGVPIFLGKFGDKLQEVSDKVTLIPGEFNAVEINKQLAEVVAGVKSIVSGKGYHFDSLYQMTENQGGDVKNVRNQVQELKALVEVQKTILEQKLNEPVMKTWFESQ